MKYFIYAFTFILFLQNFNLVSDHEVARPQSCPATYIFSHGTTEIITPIEQQIPTGPQTRIDEFIRRPQPRTRQENIAGQRQQARQDALQAARNRNADQRQENNTQTLHPIDEELTTIIASTQALTVSHVEGQTSTIIQEL